MANIALALILFSGQILATQSAYKIGVGIADSTGPAAEVVFMGYAKMNQKGEGIHLRQYTRAFIIENDMERIAFVSVDGAMIGHGLKKEVLRRLDQLIGKVYTFGNFILSATHSHSTPGGYMMHALFDFSCYGFVKQTFAAMADGITRAVHRAHHSLTEGKIFLSSGRVLDVNVNRSPHAYLQNPKGERDQYEHNVDKELVQLKFVSSEGRLLGVINWYPIHPTSMNNTNHLISSDNVGYASILLEKNLNNPALPGQGNIVAAFASSNLGDVSPNTKGPHCLDTDADCNTLDNACNGDAKLCVASGPGNDMFDSTRIIATRLYEKALELLQSPNAQEVTGPLRIGHKFVDMTNQNVTYKAINGSIVQGKGCVPAMGYSFAAGTTDGPGEFDFKQGSKTGNRFWDSIRNVIAAPTKEDKQCHYPKPILFATGRMNFPYMWQPNIVPIQVALIGNVAIIAVPGEFTTMSGRRMKREMKEVIENEGGEKNVKVIIAGLSNMYTDYITTPEEYQRYEAASTIYGPHTLPIYIERYRELIQRLLQSEGEIPVSEPQPPDFSNKLIGFVLPVLFDLPFTKNFGYCTQQPPSNVQVGEKVSVKFVSANPRNNLRQEHTFLTVEKLNEEIWDIIATDSSWETKFIWKHKYKLSPTSTAIIEWDIPIRTEKGLYRIRHYGTAKSIWGTYTDFEGETRPFNVV